MSDIQDLQAEVLAVRDAIEQADKIEGWSGNWVEVASCSPDAVVAALADQLRAGRKWKTSKICPWCMGAFAEEDAYQHKCPIPDLQERIAALEAVLARQHRRSIRPASVGEHRGRFYCLNCTTSVDDFTAYVDWPCPPAREISEILSPEAGE